MKGLRCDTLNIYAIVGQKHALVARRIRLDAALQNQLRDLFGAQEHSFLGDELELDFHAFDPAYRPDRHEMFRVEGYELPPYLRTVTSAPDGVEPIGIREVEDGSIRALCAAVPGEIPRFLFQKFDRGQVLKQKRSLLLSGGVFRGLEQPGLVLGTALSAALVGNNLYFRTLRTVARFLPVADLFVEATDREIRSFLGHPHLAVRNADAAHAMCDDWMRRRVAMVLKTGVLNRLGPTRLADVAASYGVELRVNRDGEHEALEVPITKKGLRTLLRFLSDEFLQSELTARRFQVNSKRPVGSGAGARVS